MLVSLAFGSAQPISAQEDTAAHSPRDSVEPPPAAGPTAPKLPHHVAVVCPAVFRPSLKPWIAYRQKQGYRVTLVPETIDAKTPLEPVAVKESLRKLHEKAPVGYLLLVGDGGPSRGDSRSEAPRYVPSPRIPAKVIAQWGEEDHIATDTWYADLDGDASPELAVGRFPVDSPEQLSGMINRIIDYETSPASGLWQRRLNFVAGLGGFGAMLDLVVESTARYFLTELIPPEYEVTLTHASWKSPFCPRPDRFRDVTLERMNEGCLFWIYLGHGYHVTLDALRTPLGDWPIFSRDDLAAIDCRRGMPIVFFCACYTGAIDAWDDCLAEEMVRREKGPIAAIAATRVTMPYGMALLSTGLVDQCFREHPSTLGEAIHRAKRELMPGGRKKDRDEGSAGKIRGMLHLLAKLFDPSSDQLARQRLEHVHLFHLFGDPLLQMRYPEPLSIEVAEEATSGTTLRIAGVCSLSGPVTLELVTPRDRAKRNSGRTDLNRLDAATCREYETTYAHANRRTVLSVTTPCREGRFTTTMTLPETLEGTYWIRGSLQQPPRHALGSAIVEIASERPEATETVPRQSFRAPLSSDPSSLER